MKLRLLKPVYFLLLVLSPFFLQSEIIETKNFNEIHQHLQPGMLVVLDIDNTLIEPVQELGTNQWFESRIKDYRSYGYDCGPALEKALREWTAVQNITNVREVEPGIAEIIHNLQLQGIPIIGLTTRGLGLSTRTVEQLESVHINLSLTAPTKKELFFMNERGVLFRGGVLFTAATHKGKALKKLLKKIRYLPSSVLFVNDKRSHLLPVEETCAKKGVPFTGLRYGYLDDRVKNMRKQIAEVQLHFFGHILSNEAAERVLHES